MLTIQIDAKCNSRLLNPWIYRKAYGNCFIIFTIQKMEKREMEFHGVQCT